MKLNTLADQLRPIAERNAEFMRELAAKTKAKSRNNQDFHYAERVGVQATRWSELTVPAPKR